jgi:ACR3 family arsenite transporter
VLVNGDFSLRRRASRRTDQARAASISCSSPCRTASFIPVIPAQDWRCHLREQGQECFDTILALLATLVPLIAFQGDTTLGQPLISLLLAIPISIQVVFNSALAYWLNRRMGEQHRVACPSTLIGASSFFELVVVTVISLFGFESGAALATVVAVLIEVPLMLLVVRVLNRTKGW